MRPFLLVFLSFFLLAGTGIVSAQTSLNSLGGGSEIEINLSPAFPEPGQKLVVSIGNFSSDLYGSEITWSRDGIVIPDAKNVREFVLETGKDGREIALDLSVLSPNGSTRNVSRVIQPIYLDIILEPQTHVPTFYHGRSLPSPGSIINATALIFGNNTPIANLIYTWEINQSFLSGGGQRAQNKVSFETPQDSKVLLTLDVSTIQGERIARKSMLIPTVRPSLKFYEVNTLYGVIPRPVTNFLLLGNSTTLRAEPYYLDSRVYNNPDVSTWKIDNQALSSGSNPYEITVQKILSSGTSNVSFQVQSVSKLLQGAKANMKVTY